MLSASRRNVFKDKDPPPRDTQRFLTKGKRITAMMQDKAQQNEINACIREREPVAVEKQKVSVDCAQIGYIHPDDRTTRRLSQMGSEQGIAAANVKHARLPVQVRLE